ncbi:putative lipoprotein [Leptospira yanagawae serovar Saopaulo str. Sao Paulo = ATCC 700523]|uniref:Putative lipoprotein n=1 Tax=Leptospira yanagawae serovar Saopaulo str. Sao Paulo = ATCC 700523 TaxID=1249483 RepID=A0A5E8HBW8_9LEPT|nr:putative lipoprotein [Leptospira yanagawae serovar Saopaulo str. Sao Paulo = ATCC 700523]
MRTFVFTEYTHGRIVNVNFLHSNIVSACLFYENQLSFHLNRDF